VSLNRIPVIVDCDPGHDDAVALFFAYAREEIDIRLLSTVAGNQTVEKTTLNARKIMSFLEMKAPVARGAAKPLFRDLITAEAIHGESGLDGPALPDACMPEVELSAFSMMVRVLEESERPLTIVATAALTNVGLLLLLRPDLKSRIERISLMGGALTSGNWSPSAEFNILVDPEAAHVVFSSGLPIIMSPLELTHRALVTASDIERIRAIGGRSASLVAKLLDYFWKVHERAGFAGAPLHDLCAVAALAAPEIFRGERASVQVECDGIYSSGATVVSMVDSPDSEANVMVLLEVDREALVDLLVRALETLS